MKTIRKGIYRDSKGDLYRVLEIGRHTETLENYILYQILNSSKDFSKNIIWICSQEEFFWMIDIDGKQVPRFIFLTSFEKSVLLYNVPFHKNNIAWTSCAQACMCIVLDYFLQKKYTLDEMDTLTGRRDGFYTWSHQIAPVLYDLWLHIQYLSHSDTTLYLEGEWYIRRTFPEDADEIMKTTDIPTMIQTLQRLLQYDLYKKKKVSLQDLERHVRCGRLTIVLVDWNILYRKRGLFSWHFIILVGYDKSHIFYHEVGPREPTPYKKVSKNIFEKARNTPPTDNDCIVIFGRK